MVLELVITIVFIVFLLVFAWGILQKLFKVLVFAGVVLAILITLTTFSIYSDISDLKGKFSQSTKMIILTEGEEVLTGFLLNGDVSFLSDSQLDAYSSYLSYKDYKRILGDNYKLMIFSLEMLESVDDEIVIGKSSINREEIREALLSDSPFKMLESKDIDKEDLDISDDDANSNARVKAALFGSILENNVLSTRNPLFLFSEFKEGNIIIYPETALFKAVRIVPLKFIEDTSKKILEKTKEKTEALVDENQ